MTGDRSTEVLAPEHIAMIDADVLRYRRLRLDVAERRVRDWFEFWLDGRLQTKRKISRDKGLQLQIAETWLAGRTKEQIAVDLGVDVGAIQRALDRVVQDGSPEWPEDSQVRDDWDNFWRLKERTRIEVAVKNLKATTVVSDHRNTVAASDAGPCLIES